MAFDSSGFVTTTLSYLFTPLVLIEVRYESRPGMPPVSALMSKDGIAPPGTTGWPLPLPSAGRRCWRRGRAAAAACGDGQDDREEQRGTEGPARGSRHVMGSP